MRQEEKEKKNLVPNSVLTRPGEENSEKIAKKLKKIKKPLSDIICSENGMRQAEKARKKFNSRIPIIIKPGKKFQKKQKKNSKN